MDTKVLLCKNCKHLQSTTAKCLAQIKMDYVFGIHDYFYAETQRKSSCGSDAKWFELAVSPLSADEEAEELACIPFNTTGVKA